MKYWGSKYDKGIKCKTCGKEISKISDEQDHMRGADPELDNDVELHRENEASFRFKDSLHLNHG